MPTSPKTRYAKSGDPHIADELTGSGPVALVLVPGEWRLWAVTRAG